MRTRHEEDYLIDITGVDARHTTMGVVGGFRKNGDDDYILDEGGDMLTALWLNRQSHSFYPKDVSSNPHIKETIF